MANINILLVGAGAGSGNINGNGGGGGGNVTELIGQTINGSLTVTVGSGGTGNGQSTSISGSIGTTVSGGLAGLIVYNPSWGNQFNGGTSGSGIPGGTGNSWNSPYGTGGGGGAIGAGGSGVDNGNANGGGLGGAGKLSTITGLYYGGGGGGGNGYNSGGSAGGVGGGGTGGGYTTAAINPLPGTPNTGGGAGGTSTYGGAMAIGGSGVVVISYKIDGADGISNTSTGGIITQSGMYQVHTFTSSGTFNFVVAVIPPVISTISDIHFTNNILSNYNLSTHATAPVFPITGYGLTGTLPTGISFDNVTGIISGISAVTGTYLLVFEATNQSGTTTKTFNLIINSPTAPVMGVIVDITVNSFNVINKDFSLDVTQTNQDPILSYTLTGTLIPGLNFNTTTGILSGNPTQVGTYGFGIQATDKDGISNTSNFNIIINKSKEIIKESGFFDLITNTT